MQIKAYRERSLSPARLLLFSKNLDTSDAAVTSEEEARRVSRFQRAVDRHRFLAAREALRQALETATGIAGWQIQTNANGQPRAVGPVGHASVHVSQSHDGGQWLGAVSTSGPVGVDLESGVGINRAGIVDSLAWTHPPRHDRGQEIFLRAWARREALAKALGYGLTEEVLADENAWAWQPYRAAGRRVMHPAGVVWVYDLAGPAAACAVLSPQPPVADSDLGLQAIEFPS